MVVIPRDLIPQVLHVAHDLLGHNGIGRTYAIIKRLYYWKGMKATITKHIRNCYKCQQRNRQVIKYQKYILILLLSPCISYQWI